MGDEATSHGGGDSYGSVGTDPLVVKLFGDPNVRTFAEDYVAELRETWREIERSLSRTLFFMILLTTLFILIAQEGAASVKLPIVTLSDTSLVLKVLPPIVAYFTWTMVLLIVDSRVCREVHAAVIKRVWPSMYAKNLENVLEPVNQTFLFHARFAHSLAEGGGYQQLLNGLGLARITLFLLWPIGFLVWAYVTIIGTFGIGDLLTWISIIATTVLCVGAAGTLVAGINLDVSPRLWEGLDTATG